MNIINKQINLHNTKNISYTTKFIPVFTIEQFKTIEIFSDDNVLQNVINCWEKTTASIKYDNEENVRPSKGKMQEV